ncbi:tagaturonate reductase [uncultured Oscillibacter sp.]|uniref:tagaturonate reductase n=1 Tax=uncultured Oscillibacter sp. TaxID=876091 RepID=UPI0025E86BF2|nr:tagaturonate reductase [uncultured Oscillibacter sp.]
MDRLCYETLARQAYGGYLLREAPERVLQFGEGGFLRAFVDHFIDEMNEKAGFNGKVVLVQPRGGHPEAADCFTQQDGLYTLILRGRENGRGESRARVISCVSRCLDPKRDWKELLACAENPDLRFIVSNTTEAGIVFDPACGAEDAPPASFPAKLTAFLYRRFQVGLPGFWILPCELNDHNGDLLRECLLRYAAAWGLEESFLIWLERENHICSTLVDRIVTGYPKAEAEDLCRELGYEDRLLDTGELFGAWIVEAPESLARELPFEKAGLPVRLVDDYAPYKERKVRILNGAHTSMVLGAYLAGQNIVRGCMEDEVIRGFLDGTVRQEIIPTLDLPRAELEEFADAVAERFNNPYIDHALLSIALNSTAKWKARVLPSVTDYVRRTGTLPRRLTFSFAAYVTFYHNASQRGEGCLIGRRGEDTYEVRDDAWVLDFYDRHRGGSAREIIHAVVNEPRMWDGALAELPGFEEAAAAALERIEAVGMYEAMRECL